MQDLTVIYLTANEIPLKFADHTQRTLSIALSDEPLIIVSKRPSTFEGLLTGRDTRTLIFDTPRSHINIYREALEGAKTAETRYIAIAEDDVLYSPEHFMKRPKDDRKFAYNIACWSIYTWSEPPVYSYSGRRNFGQLICNRELFIEAMEQRFVKYKDDSQIDNSIWAEPGKYEAHLGVTVRETEQFYTDPANIMFTHEHGLSMNTLGKRKRLAPIRAYDIPYWGRAEEIVKLYE